MMGNTSHSITDENNTTTQTATLYGIVSQHSRKTVGGRVPPNLYLHKKQTDDDDDDSNNRNEYNPEATHKRAVVASGGRTATTDATVRNGHSDEDNYTDSKTPDRQTHTAASFLNPRS